jgi:hypothetical protein
MQVDRGIQSEEEYEYQRTKMEYISGSDKADPLSDSKRVTISGGDFRAIDELVEEENLETTRKKSDGGYLKRGGALSQFFGKADVMA